MLQFLQQTTTVINPRLLEPQRVNICQVSFNTNTGGRHITSPILLLVVRCVLREENHKKEVFIHSDILSLEHKNGCTTAERKLYHDSHQQSKHTVVFLQNILLASINCCSWIPYTRNLSFYLLTLNIFLIPRICLAAF